MTHFGDVMKSQSALSTGVHAQALYMDSTCRTPDAKGACSEWTCSGNRSAWSAKERIKTTEVTLFSNDLMVQRLMSFFA